jgi:methionyl-tRNA formyltransferase
MNKDFVFFGTPKFAATILEGLVKEGYKPDLVITEPKKPVGRRQILTPSAVNQTAREFKLPVKTPKTKAGVKKILVGTQYRFAVVAAYGKIIPREVIDLFPLGMINVHGSILPKYRGASPVQAAILNGDRQTGLSFMLIEPEMDTGPVLAMVTQDIAADDTTESLTKKLSELAADTLPEVLNLYLANSIDPQPQNHGLATYTTKISKTDGQISLAMINPIELDRNVRAYTPWPKVYTEEFGTRLIIHCGNLRNGKYQITRLQWANKKPVSGAEFASAYPDILTKLPTPVIIAGN